MSLNVSIAFLVISAILGGVTLVVWFMHTQAFRKPRIYLCSPFRGVDEKKNVEFARAVARELSLAGAVVFCPHIYFTQFLNDALEVERNIGIVNGQETMSMYDEVWFVLPVWRNSLSSGMIWDQKTAKRLGKKCRYALSNAAYQELFDELKVRSTIWNVRPSK